MNNLRASGREPASLAPRMSIVYRAIDELKPDPAKPRRHSPKQVRQIADSIEVFGFNVPVLVDRDGKVIAGHGRILPAQLGMDRGADDLPRPSDRGTGPRLYDRRQPADRESPWDDRLLAEQLKELSVLDLDFSLEATGFEMGEIDLRIDGLDDAPNATRTLPMPCRTASGRR